MKKYIPTILISLFSIFLANAQSYTPDEKQRRAILTLIDLYSQARETSDTVLLKNILTEDIDQLVSNGEWRKGIRSAVEGMMRSSAGNPGTRKLIVETIKFLDAKNAVADAHYEIQNPDGTQRKMWSTFIVVLQNDQWRIAAIRNMLPAGSQ